eukprot:8529043-Lingulodinium_polyedra.AAC.1
MLRRRVRGYKCETYAPRVRRQRGACGRKVCVSVSRARAAAQRIFDRRSAQRLKNIVRLYA